MCSTHVLVLLALLIGFVHSFHWDIVVGQARRLEFYYNKTLTHTEQIPSAYDIHSISYDPVHYRVLFVDYINSHMLISSFDISTKKIQLLFTRDSNRSYNARVVYDPATQLLFWKKNKSIHFFSYKSDKVGEENLLLTLDHICLDIAVDSCGGYIYWITNFEIEKARLDGSEREVIIDSKVSDRRSLAIDQQTQKIYWTEKISDNGIMSIESANFNGKNRTTLYSTIGGYFVTSLAVSKDFIYWQQYYEMEIFQLPKNPSQQTARKLLTFSSSCVYCRHVAANYTMNEQIQGIKSCEAIQYLIPNNSKPESTVSICQNYCLQGNCSVSAEGQPICSCKIGYSGERCEVNECHKHCLNGGVCFLNEEDEPACECTADYDGERCEVTACKDNCVSTEEETKFRCDPDNSGESKVNACHQYCLNSGVCSLDEKSEPVCQCPADYEGERCDVPAFLMKCILYAYQNAPPATLSNAVQSTCASPLPVV